MTSKARRTLATAAAAVLLAAPAAQAMPMDQQTGRPARHHLLAVDRDGVRGSARRPHDRGAAHRRAGACAGVGGFDWIAAAIGAVVATGLVLGSWTVLHARRPVGRRAVA